jgi:hypothetical protein
MPTKVVHHINANNLHIFTAQECEEIERCLYTQADNYSGVNEAAYAGIVATLEMLNDQWEGRHAAHDLRIPEYLWRVVEETLHEQDSWLEVETRSGRYRR